MVVLPIAIGFPKKKLITCCNVRAVIYNAVSQGAAFFYAKMRREMKVSEAKMFFSYCRESTRRTILYIKKHPEMIEDDDSKKAYSIILDNYMRQTARFYNEEYTQESASMREFILEIYLNRFPRKVETYKDDAEFVLNLYKKNLRNLISE